MKYRWVGRLFGIALLITIVIAGFGQAVLQLWNLLMPEIFGLHPITFWQAVGLLALSWILFGGLRGWGMGRGCRPSMRRRWEEMSPEERERFRQGMRGRCGGTPVPPSPEVKA